MREDLYKSLEIITENQRNADNKAYLFIIIISAFLAYANEVLLIDASVLKEMSIILFILLITPLFIFILSLFPKYNSDFKICLKKKKNLELNIFYWKSISIFKNEKEFENALKEKYNVEIIDNISKDLVKQIYTNSMILEFKRKLHVIAFAIIYQLIIIAFIGFIDDYFFNNNYYITIPMLLLLEGAILYNNCKRRKR